MVHTDKEICLFLEKKLSLFQRYLSVTKRIKEAFEDEGKGNPGVFIVERQGLINSIEKIDSTIEKVSMEGMPQSGLSEYREKIETHLQDIRALMETVKPLDDDLIAMVGRKEEQAKKSLLKMQNARRAVNGYQRTGKSIPKFFDALR